MTKHPYSICKRGPIIALLALCAACSATETSRESRLEPVLARSRSRPSLAAPMQEAVDPAVALGRYREALKRLCGPIQDEARDAVARAQLLDWWSELHLQALATTSEPEEIDVLLAHRLAKTEVLGAWLRAQQGELDDRSDVAAEEGHLQTSERLRARAELIGEVVAEHLGAEHDAWLDTIYPLLDPGFLNKLVERRELLQRKYLGFDDGGGGNFVEGYLNSRIGITRYSEDSVAWYREAGVSAFEIPFRVEPLVGFEDDGRSEALLLSTGFLFHLFPDEVERAGFSAKVSESFWSEHVRRVGLRLGAGVGWRDTADANFVLGAGLQVRSITIWWLHDFEADENTLMLGISDLSFLTEWLPIFGLGGGDTGS